MATASEQEKRSKTKRHEARKAIAASSATLDKTAFDGDDDDEDGSKECS